MDYIFRRLALDYLPFETRAELGIFSAEERAAQVSGYGTRPRRPTSSRRTSTWRRCAARAPIETAAGRGEGHRRGPTSVKEAHSSTELLELRHRHGRRRAAVHDLRHEDAPGRQLLRLRGLRLHQRLQLTATPSARSAEPPA